MRDKMSETTSEYWDCGCDDDYIHPANHFRCPICGVSREEQPDSKVEEVIEKGFPLDVTT
jgi:hypothetical protein